jgi:hypothetical protein
MKYRDRHRELVKQPPPYALDIDPAQSLGSTGSLSKARDWVRRQALI